MVTRWPAVSLCILSFIAVACAFTFTIEANREECFYEHAEQGDTIGIMYHVTSGGFLDINLQVCVLSPSHAGQLLFDCLIRRWLCVQVWVVCIADSVCY